MVYTFVVEFQLHRYTLPPFSQTNNLDPLLSKAVPTGATHPLPILVLENPVGRTIWLVACKDIRINVRQENTIFLKVLFKKWRIKII